MAHPTMLNPDPTNEYMYQVPFQGSHQTGMAAAGGSENNDLDLAALNQRLRTLGLHHSSESLLPPLAQQSQHLGGPHQQQHPPPQSNPTLFPATAELGPSDSISMYRHPLPHTRSGGTNVDPGEEAMDQYESYGTPGQETRRSPPLDDEYFEQMTMGQSQWNATTVNNLAAMRDRLVNEQANPSLVSALAKLESSEEQLRTLQATLIAERVARTQMEQQAQTAADDMRDYRHELSSAVRALRRARDEGKKNDEERRRLQRAFDEAQKSLNVYNTALEVRKAREQGRVEGREEAWAEAGRWMGHSPPIPVEPVQSVPEAVLRNTPGPNSHAALNPLGPQPQAYPVEQQQNAQASYPQPSHTMHSGPRPTPDPPLHGHHGQESEQAGWNPQTSGPGDHLPSQQGYGQPGFNTGHNSLRPPGMSQSAPYSNQPGQTHPNHPGHPPQTYQSHPGQASQTYPIQSSQPGPNAAAYTPAPPQRTIPASGEPSHQLPHVQASANNRGGLQHAKSQGASMRPQPASRQQDHRRSQSLTVPPRADTTDSYLDRVEHDPRLRSMLSGAPTRTIHTPVPMTGSSVNTGTDKPLPPTGNKSRRSASQRHSLMDGLHGQHATAHINTGDRYPTFPKNGRGHSRQSSFGSADPARRHHDSQTATTMTPGAGRHRSKMAGALRANNELEPLTSIDEEQLPQQHPSNPPPQQPQHSGHLQQQHPQQQQQHPQQQQQQQQQYYASRGPPKSKGKYAPSMPPLRARPTPVMPQPLGKSGSEPHDPSSRMPQAGPQRLVVPDMFGNGMSDPGRQSALGLEGMGQYNDAAMKPPTIMIQPPSSRSNNKSEVRSVNPQGHKSTQPHDVPLPPSAAPHDIPLPPTNAHAPTAYTPSAFSPDRPLPNVNIIDYARRQPLPVSRPTTFFANTITTEIEAEGPDGHIHARKQVSIPRRKPPPSFDPRQVPLPASRAGTRARTSTYAGTIPTIDEVTEDESGRETGRRRK